MSSTDIIAINIDMYLHIIHTYHVSDISMINIISFIANTNNSLYWIKASAK